MGVMKSRVMLSVCRIAASVAVIVLILGCAISQPSFRSNRPSDVTVDPERLRGHVRKLSEEFHPRDYEHSGNLDKCADYIEKHFAGAGAAVTSQVFTVLGVEYRNVIGRFGGDDFLAFLTRFDPAQFGQIGVEVAERIATRQVGDARMAITVGGAWTMIGGDVKGDLEALIRAADTALAQAREGGLVCRVAELSR